MKELERRGHLERNAERHFRYKLYVFLEHIMRVRLDVLLEEEGTHVGRCCCGLRFEQVRRDDGTLLL